MCKIVHDFRFLWFSGGLRGHFRGRGLCRTVHDFGVLKFIEYFGFGRWGRGRFLDNEFGGVEAGAVGHIGFGEDRMEGGEGLGDVVFGFFADEDGFVVLCVAEGVAKGEGGLTPVRDGVAVDRGGFGGRFYGRATGDGSDDRLLNRSDSVVVRHFVSF